ncbi:MAG: arsenate reductase ArsC [Planctomycetota bacterium]|nr:arsenate reductase ArsC [Planctomycetota bacterium]
MSESQRILFLCTANSARSQLAEAILRDRVGNRMEVCSAGTHPSVVHPLAIEVLQEIQICTDGLWSKSVRDALRDGPVSLTIAVCSSAAENCPIVDGAQVRSWPFDDPAACGEDLETQRQAFRFARDEIASKIDSWLSTEGS